MKKQAFMKAIVLSCFVAALFLLPMSLNAQRSDDFFRVGDEFNGTRTSDLVITGITNFGIGETAPLGSGLLVLVAAGAGYAVVRRQRNYRTSKSHKTSKYYRGGAALLIAVALMLDFTQCKKNIETISDVTSNGVYITLDVSNGSKVAVTPGFYDSETGQTYAKVEFENGDKIYVGNNGKYCGSLTFNSTNNRFEGTVNPTSEADYLHFYFLGNKAGDLTEGDESCTFDIIDQTSKYPVISYAHSTNIYNSSLTDYSAKLENYCAIVKFVTDVNITNVITVTGLQNQVTVNFGANNASTTGAPYSYGIADGSDGKIRLHSETNTEKWAIVLPKTTETEFDAYAYQFYRSNNAKLPVIAENGYYSGDGVAINMTYGIKPNAPGFTMNGYGDKVMFSQGNLQKIYSTGKWHFAANQWDCLGNNGQASSSAEVDRDLFKRNTWNSDLSTDIDNGGGYTWRTLTQTEWNFIIGYSGTYYRKASTINGTTDGRYTKAIINTDGTSVKGLIIFPDYYSIDTPVGVTFGTINSKTTNYTTTCTTAGWSALSAAGCIFLPAAGANYGSSIGNVNSDGYYWMADYGYYLMFHSTGITGNNTGVGTYSCSERLVRDL